MEVLSDYIADFYIRRKIISPDDKEIYKAGIKLILNEALTFLLVGLISIVISKIWYGIVFLAVFCSTRIHTGGFHAKTTFVCRTTMLGTFISVIILLKILCNYNCNFIILISLLVFSNLLLLPIIPVKHPNKSLTEKQIRKNKRNGIHIILLFSITSIILFFFHKEYGILITLSLLAVLVLAVIGKLLNERREKG